MPNRILRSFGLFGLTGALGLACLAASPAKASPTADCRGWGQRYDAPALLDRLMRPTHAKHESAADLSAHGQSICREGLRPDITKILHDARAIHEHTPAAKGFAIERTIHEI